MQYNKKTSLITQAKVFFSVSSPIFEFGFTSLVNAIAHQNLPLFPIVLKANISFNIPFILYFTRVLILCTNTQTDNTCSLIILDRNTIPHLLFAESSLFWVSLTFYNHKTTILWSRLVLHFIYSQIVLCTVTVSGYVLATSVPMKLTYQRLNRFFYQIA